MSEAIERVYVRVTSEFDETGYMQPRTIRWEDGRVFDITEVCAMHPGSQIDPAHSRMNYFDVKIGNEKRRLFFYLTGPEFISTTGRWFVEKAISDPAPKNV